MDTRAVTSHSIKDALCPLAHQMGCAAQGVVIRVHVCLGWSSAGTTSPSAAAKYPLRAPWQLIGIFTGLSHIGYDGGEHLGNWCPSLGGKRGAVNTVNSTNNVRQWLWSCRVFILFLSLSASPPPSLSFLLVFLIFSLPQSVLMSNPLSPVRFTFSGGKDGQA